MEPILLYGHPLGSSMGLIAALEWLGQPYRLSRIRMPDDMLGDDYMRLNGRRETPVLIAGRQRVITETIAIALWLYVHDIDRQISIETRCDDAARLQQLITLLNIGFSTSIRAYS